MEEVRVIRVTRYTSCTMLTSPRAVIDVAVAREGGTAVTRRRWDTTALAEWAAPAVKPECVPRREVERGATLGRGASGGERQGRQRARTKRPWAAGSAAPHGSMTHQRESGRGLSPAPNRGPCLFLRVQARGHGT